MGRDIFVFERALELGLLEKACSFSNEDTILS